MSLTAAGRLSFRELTDSAEDRRMLRRFYVATYRPAFPQPDEQEAVERLEGYLALKARGGYGRNNYHILIALHRDRPVAGVIMDYLAAANAGIIEFIVTAPGWRRHRLATRMLKWAERVARADARHNFQPDLDLMLAELEDPFKIAPGIRPDTFDRLEIWDTWGFRKLDFPYVQPALSRAQRPVTHLLLSAKPFRQAFEERVPAHIVDRAVHGYIRWAMMPLRPARSPEYRGMRRYLERVRSVPLVSLRRYIGRTSTPSLLIHEVKTGGDPDLRKVAAVYQHAFSPGETAIAPCAFLTSVRRARRRRPFVYHLWALRTRQTAAPGGMASFFTLPGAGFGGYIVFAPALRGTDRLRTLVARVEEQMVRDGKDARGWYIECGRPGPEWRIFARLGFREVAFAHRQPPLPGHRRYRVREAPVLRLMYKEFGRGYGAPRVMQDELLSALAWIYRGVYRVAHPRRTAFFSDARAQVAGMRGRVVAWR